jgi:hypothetical protein
MGVFKWRGQGLEFRLQAVLVSKGEIQAQFSFWHQPLTLMGEFRPAAN